MMKRKRDNRYNNAKSLFSVLCAIVLLASCDNIFLKVTDKEADLQGKWRMESTEAIPDTIFFNFQNKLFQYQIYNHRSERFNSTFGYYQLPEDTLLNIEILLSGGIYIPFGELGWDTVPDLQDGNRSKIVKLFKINKVTNRKLRLSAEGHEYSFNKF